MKKENFKDFLNGKATITLNKVLQDKELQRYLAVIFLALFLWLLLGPSKEGGPKNVKEDSVESLVSLDTMIPSNQSLVPIDIDMSEKLDSMIGQFARVNLFLIHPEGKNRLVAKGVKLLRAPKNPSVFAVLVPHDNIKWFMALEGRFSVSISSKQEGNGTFLVNRSKRKSKIQYGVQDDSFFPKL